MGQHGGLAMHLTVLVDWCLGVPSQTEFYWCLSISVDQRALKGLVVNLEPNSSLHHFKLEGLGVLLFVLCLHFFFLFFYNYFISLAFIFH